MRRLLTVDLGNGATPGHPFCYVLCIVMMEHISFDLDGSRLHVTSASVPMHRRLCPESFDEGTAL